MQLYNTMNRTKETFTPFEENHVRIYACGITTYDYCHIGHARSAIVFDVLVRYLRHVGYKVTFVRNFTDIDDKIINRAREAGEDPAHLAKRFIQAFYEDMDRLAVIRADKEPKCTEHIPEMLSLVEDLIEKGHAYATAGGDVYFRVRSCPAYARLSGRDIESMRSGARIEPGEEKEDPLDFALWKAAKPGEPFWESPWGPGRPGWHLECSAMSDKHLGLPFDIHGGGQDLIFPHHENEIAQSEASCGCEMARFWMHNGFVQVDSEKMSKSLGNFKTIREIMDVYQPETIRYFLLTKHYRSPIDFTLENMEEAEKNLHRIYTLKQELTEAIALTKWSTTPVPEEIAAELATLESSFEAAMADDINTAAALGHIFGVVRLAGRIAEDKALRKSEKARTLWIRILGDLENWGAVLGVFQHDPAKFLTEQRTVKIRRKNLDETVISELLEKRDTARKAKDFVTSDTLRDELQHLGIAVKDTPTGQVWDVM